MNTCSKSTCNGGDVLKQKLEGGDKENSLNYSMLKEKIIETDFLIQKCIAKNQENEHLSRRLDDVSLMVDQLRRDCLKYEEELEKSLKESEPLRKAWDQLEEEKQSSSAKLRILHDRLAASEKLVLQYEMLLKEKEEKEKEYKDYDKLLKDKVRKEKQLDKAKDDGINLRLKLQRKSNKLKRINISFLRTVEHLVNFGNFLDKKGILSKSYRRILTHYKSVSQRGRNINSSEEEEEDGAGKALEDILLNCKVPGMFAPETSPDRVAYISDASDTEKQSSDTPTTPCRKSVTPSPTKRRTSPRKHGIKSTSPNKTAIVTKKMCKENCSPENKDSCGESHLFSSEPIPFLPETIGDGNDITEEENQSTLPSTQSEVSLNHRLLSDTPPTDTNKHDQEPLSGEVEGSLDNENLEIQEQRSDVHFSINQKIICGKSYEKFSLNERASENESAVKNSFFLTSLYEDNLQNTKYNSSSTAENIDEENFQCASNAIALLDHHLSVEETSHTTFTAHNKENENYMENVTNESDLTSDDLKKCSLSQENNAVKQVSNTAIADGLCYSKSTTDDLYHDVSNSTESDVDKVQSAKFEMTSNKTSNIDVENRNVGNYSSSYKQTNESFDINDLDVIRSQMCLQAECLSPLSPLPPTPPPMQESITNSPKNFSQLNRILPSKTIETSSLHCEYQEDDSVISSKGVFETDLNTMDMKPSDSSHVSKVYKRKKFMHFSKINQFKNNGAFPSEAISHDSKQCLSHQKSEGFEVSNSYDASEANNSNHIEAEEHDIFHNNSYRQDSENSSPSYRAQHKNVHDEISCSGVNSQGIDTLSSHPGSSRLQANFSHSAKDGHFKVSVRLPNESFEQRNDLVTSLFLELDTQTKELSLSWCPETVRNNTAVEKQMRDTPNFNENTCKEKTSSSPETNFDCLPNVPSNCKKNTQNMHLKENNVSTTEVQTENTRTLPLLNNGTKHIFCEKTLTTNHTDIPKERHQSSNPNWINNDKNEMPPKNLSDSDAKQICGELTPNLLHVPETDKTDKNDHDIGHQNYNSYPAFEKLLSPVETFKSSSVKDAPEIQNRSSIPLEVSIKSGSPFKKRFSDCSLLAQWNKTTDDTDAILLTTPACHSHPKSPLENERHSLQPHDAFNSHKGQPFYHPIDHELNAKSSDNLKRSLEQVSTSISDAICGVTTEHPAKKFKIQEIITTNCTTNENADMPNKESKELDSKMCIEQSSKNEKSRTMFQSNFSSNHFWRLRYQDNSIIESLVTHLQKMGQLKNECTENKFRVQNNIVCMMLNPITSPSAEDVITSIIHHLMLLRSNPYQNNNNILPPILMDAEKFLVSTLLNVELKQKSHLQNLISGLKVALLAQIFEKKNTSPYGIASLCRVYTALCRHRNNIMKARILCYDMFYKGLNMAAFFVSAVVGVWPDVMHVSNTTTGWSCPLQKVLIYCVFKKMACLPQNLRLHCSHVLEHWCKIERKENNSPTALAKELLEDLKIRNKTDVFEFIKALELLAAEEGWEWTNDTLVRSLLWPLLQKWSMKQDNPNEPAITDIEAAALVRLLGSLGHLCPKDKLEGVKNMMLTLKMLLIRSSEVSFCVQEAAFSSLLQMLPFGNTIVSSVLDSWISQNETDIAEINTKQLLDATMTKKTLGVLRQKDQETVNK